MECDPFRMGHGSKAERQSRNGSGHVVLAWEVV